MKRIVAEGVSKKFGIGVRRKRSALARVLSLFSGREQRKTLWALSDVSLSVDAGEVVGMIGANGSGKSTLLRVIAGIHGADGGNVRTCGKVVPMINLYVGLNARLSMRDNIYMCCSLFGMSRKEIDRRFSSIAEFAGLSGFVDTKIYQFSDGMKQRLSFSIAIHCDPQILLIDEVFEAGDEEFRMKSAGRIKELVGRGASVILVSHDLSMVEKYCDRVIWLDKGRIVMEGGCRKVVGRYCRQQASGNAAGREM